MDRLDTESLEGPRSKNVLISAKLDLKRII